MSCYAAWYAKENASDLVVWLHWLLAQKSG